MDGIRRARGAVIGREDLKREDRLFSVTDFGARPGGDAVKNTGAVNAALEEAFRQGGGTVTVPEGPLRPRLPLFPRGIPDAPSAADSA